MKKLLLLPLYVCLAIASHGATIALQGLTPASLASGNSVIKWTNNAQTGNTLDYYAISFNVTSSAIASGSKSLIGMYRGVPNAAGGLVLALGVGSGTSFNLILGTGQNASTVIGESAGTIDISDPITMIYRAGAVSVYSGNSLVISAAVADQDDYRMTYNDSSFWTNGAAQKFTDIQALSGDSAMTDRDVLVAFDIITIPEPATASLALLGLAGFAVRRRR